MLLFLSASLQADVTLVATLESHVAPGVEISGSDQWRIQGLRARWDHRISAKGRGEPLKLSLHDRSCLIVDLRHEIVRVVEPENGQFSEIAFREWKAYADKQYREDNPFLDPTSDQSISTRARFMVLSSTESALIGRFVCRKTAYEISFDVRETGFRVHKRCRILATFWMTDATPDNLQVKSEVDSFFRVFEQKTGDQVRFANPLTLGAHAWAEKNIGKSDLTALMRQLESEVRTLQGVPVRTEMETSLDRHPVLWYRTELKTLSRAMVSADVFNTGSEERGNQ
jgi:hypothetical protein